ncbi:hypothetical protein Agub_g10866, partial [Astrephomene gubernaculifera]
KMLCGSNLHRKYACGQQTLGSKRALSKSWLQLLRYAASCSRAPGSAEGVEHARKAFKFRHFLVHQDRCAMKMGTDAMLLGSWAPVPQSHPSSSFPSPSLLSSTSSSPHGPRSSRRVLDVGTGTGVLALMAAQKSDPRFSTSAPVTSASPTTTSCSPSSGCTMYDEKGSNKGTSQAGVHIVAIDIDADACAQAAENVALSPWADRITVLHASLQQLVAAAAAAAAMTPTEVTTPTAGGAAAEVEEAEAAAAGAGTAAAAAGEDPEDGTETLGTGAVDVADPVVVVAAGGGGNNSSSSTIPAGAFGPFDLIISNPPYFVGSSKPAQGRTARAFARHADVALPFADLASGCTALLAPGGSVCVVLPPPEAERFLSEAAAFGLVLVELVRVFSCAEDVRERRQLLRLQRDGELQGQGQQQGQGPQQGQGQQQQLPVVSSLVINGPKLKPSERPSELDQGPGKEEQHDPQQQQPPRPVRLFTSEYLALTADFHDPAFFTSYNCTTTTRSTATSSSSRPAAVGLSLS